MEWLRYRIITLVGGGGMGEVYCALDTRLNRSVAIKFLARDKADAVARKRFQREAQMASALNHPHILTVYDAGDFEGRQYLVTEFIDGGTLYDWIRSEPRDWRRVVELLLGVGDGLSTAHEAGILHRDIKPANILVTKNGYAKLADFGLAKHEELARAQQEGLSASDYSSPGMILGTIAYMSPEQAMGKPLDIRSDIFSFGVTLYEALTGRRPFAESTMLEVLQAIIQDESVPLPQEFPKELRSIVERALEKDPDRRYQTMRELTVDLKQSLWLEGGFQTGQNSSATLVSPEASITVEPAEAFVGREPELHKLEQLLDRALSGTGRIVFITGEPGIGKTALAAEFLLRSHSRVNNLIFASGRCLEQFGTAEAYLPFIGAVGELLRSRQRNSVATVLRTHALTWCKQFPSVFGSADTLERLNQETIGATRERMLREMADSLVALSTTVPLVMVLEDLHWADPSTTDLLRLLGQRIHRHRLLLIGTYRPEEIELKRHPLKNYKLEMLAHNQCEEIALHVLSTRHVANYLHARCTPNDFPPEFAELVERKTEGHPLFTTSVVQFFIERGYISQAGEQWTLVRPLSEIDVNIPEDVRSMIRKKIGSLADDDQRALQYASIEGEEFTSAILAGLLEVDEVLLEERLDRLDKVHRLIHARGEEELPDGSLTTRYRFTHVLYHNQLYEGLVKKRRMMLHLRAGELLLRFYEGRIRSIAAQLAVHFERGRDFGRAVEYLIQAGDNAVDLFASPEAAGAYSRAFQLVAKHPGENQRRTRLTICQKLGAVNLAMGRLDRAVGDFTAALHEASELADPMLKGTVLTALCHTLFFAHRLDEMAVRAQEAMQVAQESGNEALRAWILGLNGRRHGTLGLLAEGTVELNECIRLATVLQHKPALLTGCSWSGLIHFFRSEYESAEAKLLQSHDLSLELRDGFMVLFSLYFLGLTQAEMGRISEALATFNKALEMARRNGDRNHSLKIPNGMGWIYREMGDIDRAIEYNAEGARVSRENQLLEAEINSTINLGYDRTLKRELSHSEFNNVEEMLNKDDWLRWRFNIRLQAGKTEYFLAHGDVAGAEQCAQGLLQTATTYEANKYIAIAHRLLAEAAAKRGDLDDAQDQLNKALAILERYPTPIVSWKVYAALGRVLLQSGNRQSAQDAFARSRHIVDQIAANITDERLLDTFRSSAQSELLGLDRGIK
jgi:tetratricopeptide (TPR) repeat protein/AAA+ ATPase superfamily predicted ATPase/predicted Ser/Thr protein kinase